MAEVILGEGKGEETTEDSGEATVLTGEGENSSDAGESEGEGKDASEKGGEDTDHKDGDADDKSEDSEANKDESGAPEEYKDFDLPEGVELDEEILAEFTPVLKDLGASQEDAQKLLDLQMKMAEKVQTAQNEEWAETQDKWVKDGEADKEFGKGKYDESVSFARKALLDIGTPELRAALESTGMGNHPEFVRFFFRVGKAISEDDFSFGKEVPGTKKSQAERMFPNQGK